MKIERSRGFIDLSPEEMDRFRFVEDAFRSCCAQSGYREVRTPTVEYLHLFTSVGTLTPGMLKRVYSFLDWDGWSGERVVLRPDATIPVARMYVDSLSGYRPMRLCYVTNIFIFDDTGKKTRERWQCGAELIGVNSPLADAELVSLALDILNRLGLKDVEIKLSHAALIKTMLAGIGLSRSEQEAVLDKLLDGNRDALAEIKAEKPELMQALGLLLEMKGRSSGFLNNIRALLPSGMPELESSLEAFAAVCRIFDDMGWNYSIELSSGKGYEYYTGLIFHFYAGGGLIGGGGRYDALIPMMGGGQTPAAGFALYIDRLMALVQPGDKTAAITRKILLNAPADGLPQAAAIASKLRRAGYIVVPGFGCEDAACFAYTIEVKGGKKGYLLTDNKNEKASSYDSAEGLLAALGCR